METKKRIVMFGDSWPAGEHSQDNTHIQHQGLQHYFIEHGFDCINLCFPGGSNLQSVQRLENFLLTNTSTGQDIIIFWMTEFFRELWYYHDYKNENNLQEQLQQSYTQLRESWISRPYYQLQDLAEKYSKTIYILGGASDTINYPDFNKDFPRLQILCQSITNLIVNNNPSINDPVYCEFLNGWIDPFLSVIKQDKMSNHDLEELTRDMQKGKNRLDQFKHNPQWFYPDGIHPNRLGHKKLFDFLIKKTDIFD